MSTSKFKPRGPKKIVFTECINILWKDNTQTRISYYDLRCDCPCAACVDELTGQRTLDPNRISPQVYPKKSEYVGNYALRIYWSDQHDTGIYTFRFLRERYGSEAVQEA